MEIAVESGAGVPLEALMRDGDLAAAAADYLEWRAKQMQKER